MLTGHRPASFSDLLWVGELALLVTVCPRAGLERPPLLPKVGREQGGSPQGGPDVVELWPHLPFLTSRPTQASLSPDEETATQETHSPTQGSTE